MGSVASNNIDIYSDDAEFISLVDQVSNEIDNYYKEDDDHTNTKHLKYDIPDFVIAINSIAQLYTYHTLIGKGVSGSVFLAQSNQTYKQYALKQMLKSSHLNHSSFVHETDILKQLHHPNIVHLNDAYISNEYYYITTEYCTGGTLLQRIKNMKRFSEKDSARFIKQILEAVNYIHSKNIVHRDVKLSNIVFQNDDIQRSKLKLIDFGQSEIITNFEETERKVVGSLHFFPPEAVQYRQKRDLFAADIWGIGVIAFVLVEGVFPFNAKDILSMARCIITSPLKWLETVAVSDCCKDFIKGLLHKDYRKRWNAKQALQHPWIVNGDAYLNNDMVTDLNKIDDAKRKEASSKLSVVFNHGVQFSDENLNEMDIDNILAEIDAETAD